MLRKKLVIKMAHPTEIIGWVLIFISVVLFFTWLGLKVRNQNNKCYNPLQNIASSLQNIINQPSTTTTANPSTTTPSSTTTAPAQPLIKLPDCYPETTLTILLANAGALSILGVSLILYGGEKSIERKLK